MRLKITLILVFSLFLAYQAQAQCSGATFEEKNGIAVIEAETASLPSNWKKETNVTPFTGSSYIAWRGSDFFGSPGNGLIQYSIKINSPGIYRFQWRNKVGIGNEASEHNDSWLKFPDAFDFFAKKGSNIKYPKGGTFKKSNKTVNGSSGNGWMKIYSSGAVSSFKWSTKTSDNESFDVFVEFKNAGVYKMQVSARSKGHFIDRMVLYKEGSYSEASATNLGRNETKCGSGGGDPPPPPPPPSGDNDPPTVSITNPNDGQNFNVGSTVTVNLNSGDSDGSVVKHEIFVNNSKVDTDGSSYSAHKINNISAGSYEIRAQVTDNEGETAEDIVNITVGGGGGDPPPPPPPSGDNEPPTVSISNPNDGQNFNVGSTVTVNLNSGDSDGSVVKHEIFVNNSKVDTDGSSYTAHKINNISAGSYEIRALVTDNEGATAEDIVNITVGGGGGDPPPPPPPPGDNEPPTVSITNPNEGQNFSVGSTVTVNLTAGDSDGSVVKHEIFVNNSKVDTDGAGFTPHKIKNIAEGSYTIRALVTDNEGATAEDIVNITVGGGGGDPPPPPSGNIGIFLVDASTNADIGPLSNGSAVDDGSDINIRAQATHAGVSSLRFNLQGPTSTQRTENVAPYALFGDNSGNYFSGNLQGGSYTLTVVVYDGPNGTGNLLGSRSINFTVTNGSSGKSAAEVYAYPNPVKGNSFSVKLPEGTEGEVFYRLINTSGAEIESGKIDVQNSADGVQFKVQSFDNKNNGVYYLLMQNGLYSYAVPIIKE